MNIPPINISVTKAAVDGHVVDVVDYEGVVKCGDEICELIY